MLGRKYREYRERSQKEEEDESDRSEDGKHLEAFSRDSAPCLPSPHLVRAEVSHASVQVTFIFLLVWRDIDFPVDIKLRVSMWIVEGGGRSWDSPLPGCGPSST